MKSEGILLIDQHQERDQGQLLRKDQGRGNSMLHIVAFGYFEYLLLGTAPSSPLLIFRRNLQKLIFLLSYPNNE